MQTDEFWPLVEQARADAAGPEWPLPSAIAEALVERLIALPLDRILEFHLCFERVESRADRWELCAAAYVIQDYLSDDSFSYFKAGLIGLGQTSFEKVVADGDALADIPLVQAIAAGRADKYLLSAESIDNAASTAYGRQAGDDDDFWDDLDTLPEDDEEHSSGTDEPWSGRFGSQEDAALIPVRLPRLTALFSAAKNAATNHPEP
ncbi:DUF4240 domain-containing protein [Actinoplanes awajinensis]|uniref:DUF4240 domain-containing protein n=1 Tax=Actinoplanes awajinensis subsp. mycoplanecinus TaxID=135947 RepID=A0A101JPT3_9ACTN|nr:DUF4240 domain-containing protein [Actinoplanes awajinensis]KUL30724.1 hypothetical protein ADL15_24050 [Actinoplanes awajinensis subsp. mycoplanecinus]